jgi:hypothetical protein
MVSWLTHIIGSSGNSMCNWRAISSGDHHSSRHSVTLSANGPLTSFGFFGRWPGARHLDGPATPDGSDFFMATEIRMARGDWDYANSGCHPTFGHNIDQRRVASGRQTTQIGDSVRGASSLTFVVEVAIGGRS